MSIHTVSHVRQRVSFVSVPSNKVCTSVELDDIPDWPGDEPERSVRAFPVVVDGVNDPTELATMKGNERRDRRERTASYGAKHYIRLG